MIVTTGKNLIMQRLAGVGTSLANASCYIGVGTSNTAVTAAQTDLQAGGVRVKCDTGYPQAPTGTAGVVTVVYRATFNPSTANQAWNEWGIFNTASGSAMLNRVVTNNGVKAAGQTWVFTITVTYRRG